MAISDLTNTTWVFNNSVTGDASGNITFISNGNTYTSIYMSGGTIAELEYGSTRVGSGQGAITSWTNDAYKTIEITGGQDVTKASLISWLTANATQITSGGSMYLGTSSISKMYIGQNEVSKVYFGQDLVYENEPAGFTQKYLTDSGNYSLLSDMQQNKVYTINYDSTSLSVITYSNGAWQLQNIYSRNRNLSLVSQTSTSITICEGSGQFYNRAIGYIILEGDTQATQSDFAEYTSTTGLAYWACFVEGTKISLADGTTKNVEDVDYNDDLLVWNFYDGKLDSAKPKWIMEEKTATEYKSVLLSDNTELKLVGPNEKCHRLFNVTKQQMLYANECVGEEVYKQDGSIVKVVSCNPVEQEVKFYNLTTEKYLDCFANGVLTGSRLNNMYHITNMKYDSDERLISEEEEAERWAVRKSIGYKKD